jgi:hypothetical protein
MTMREWRGRGFVGDVTSFRQTFLEKHRRRTFFTSTTLPFSLLWLPRGGKGSDNPQVGDIFS